jgi:hypothetical protein
VKIDCILPQRSQYEVLHHFTRKVGEALVRLGHSVRILEAEADLFPTEESLPDATLAFNGAPSMEDGTFLCDKWGIPHYACLVDPPLYYLGLLGSPLIKLYCDDKSSFSQLKGLGYSKGMFFTQGIEPELLAKTEGSKEYDLVFMASYFDVPEAKRQMEERLSDELYQLTERAIESTFIDNSLSLYDAFVKVIEGKAHLLEEVDFVQLFYAMSYVQKGEARNRLLMSLSGLPVHVWDMRWEGFCKENCPKAIVHEAVNYKEGLEVFKKAKIVLCNSIRSVNGCNERVLNAIACGAVAFTNNNPYFREHFIDKEHLLLYDHHDMSNNEKVIRLLLEDSEKLSKMTAAARKVVLEEHTWDDRLREIGLG